MKNSIPGLAPGPTAYSRTMQHLEGELEELNPLPRHEMVVPPSPRLAALTDNEGGGAERFRMLAARLQYLRKQRPFKKIVVTSTLKGEGKSIVSANLAFTLARHHRTLLIDGDLRQSGLREHFGNHDLPGLTNWWQEPGEIATFLRCIGEFPLWYLPPGEAMGEPLEILQSQRTSEMLAQVTEWFEWIVIDSPPLAAVADPGIWANQADGTLLVVEQGKTPKKLMRKTLESIENLKLLGVVMNASEDSSQPYYGRQYKSHPKR